MCTVYQTILLSKTDAVFCQPQAAYEVSLANLQANPRDEVA